MTFGIATSIFYRFSKDDEYEQLSAFIFNNMGLYFAHVHGFKDVLHSDSVKGLKNEIRNTINPKKRPIDIMYQSPSQGTIDDISGFWDNLED